MAKTSKPNAFYALSRVDHDGRTYEAGDAIDKITPEQAEALLAAGVLSRVIPAEDAPADDAPQGNA